MSMTLNEEPSSSMTLNQITNPTSMTIDEAIEHARDVAINGKCSIECKEQHEQLAEWLEELKEWRKREHGIRTYKDYLILVNEKDIFFKENNDDER